VVAWWRGLGDSFGCLLCSRGRGGGGRSGSEDGRDGIGCRGVRRGVGRLLDERLTERDAPPKVIKSVGIVGVAFGRGLSGGVAKVNGHAVEEVVETV
jgi:hypothetical protein